MTCKDCLHYDVCVIVEHTDKDKYDHYSEFGCEDFKNKADFVKKAEFDKVSTELRELKIMAEAMYSASVRYVIEREALEKSVIKKFAKKLFELFPTDKKITTISRVTIKNIVKELTEV